MLEKSDVILKHPSPFSIESLLGKTGEEGPCVSVSPPALQTPFLFPQLVPHTQVRPLPPHHTNINPDVFSPQNFPFDLLARGLYQNMTGLIGELFDYFYSDLSFYLVLFSDRLQQLNVWKVQAAQDSLHQSPTSRGKETISLI